MARHNGRTTATRDLRDRDGERRYKSGKPPKNATSGTVRGVDALDEALELRLTELETRAEQREPYRISIFDPDEKWSPGYGAHQAGTLADEQPRDVLDAGPDSLPCSSADVDDTTDD